ncbi:MAG: alanine--tRNA ligase [Myxococcota bacterium]|jgi:alanyl-tRNA synthetase|nr:alanine--tRNA ligase [Myxococcota bacterium]
MSSTRDIRSTFLEYFRTQAHEIIPSASLVPSADPTLMFTNAGMVPFKDVFTGRRSRPATRAATVQKCIRISGKHNDLENVGRTSRHHTFFEMLGNFSFGDYFKREACQFGWELLTKGFGMPPERLWVTVFAGDDNAATDLEAESIWRDVVGVPKSRIARLGAKDNFWAMGETGPCGPCSEIHYDRGEDFGPADLDNGERFFELWNLVFMQFFVEEPGGPMRPLPKPCIDTGAGLERIASVLQGVSSNYETDTLRPLVLEASRLSQKAYGRGGEDDVSMRVIADHARMTAFLVAEGIFPEKTGRQYVLRRVMRRAIRHGHRLGIGDPFFHSVAGKVVEIMGADYPELREHATLIERVCRQEEERFRATLGRGLELIEKNRDEWPHVGKVQQLPGDVAFELTATYGFPKDLIEVIGAELGFAIDEEGYKEAEEKHRQVSGAGKIGDAAIADVYSDLLERLGPTEFMGYETLESSAQIIALVQEGRGVEQARAGDAVEIILSRTPFYGEQGGQVGDRGQLVGATAQVTVLDAAKPVGDLIVHRGKVVQGGLRVGDSIQAQVDVAHRHGIARHHTATHLLHAALREVLGQHATQKGSYVTAKGLRFDFAHFEAMTLEQLGEVERRVMELIVANHPVDTATTSYDEAKRAGAMALFGETYGEKVRLVTVSEASKELCGGTHVSTSGSIGAFFVTSETGIAAGVRRIEAVAGLEALSWVSEQRSELLKVAATLRTSPSAVTGAVSHLMDRLKDQTKEIDALKRKLAAGKDLSTQARDIGGVKVLGAVVDVGDPGALRDTADQLCMKLGKAVVCLGGDNNGKAALVVCVAKELGGQLPAGKLVAQIAAVVGGKGGGRPDFAQAGGPNVDKLAEAVSTIYSIVENMIQ